MEEARDLQDRKDLKGALQRFQQADDIMHVPTTGLEVARVQVALGQLVEARDTLARVARYHLGKHDPPVFRDARTRAQTLDDELAVRVPGLKILARAPAGADVNVTVDDVAVPVLGVVRKTNPGHHVIVATTDTGGRARKEVDLVEKQNLEVTLVIEGGTAPLVPLPGTTEPQAPLPEAAPVQGTTEPPKRGPSRLLVYSGLGLVVIGVGVGTVTGIIELSKKSSLEQSCANHQCPPSAYSDYDTANTMATISTIGFIGAGVGAAVTVVGLLVRTGPAQPSPSTASSKVSVSPWLGLGAAGVRGQF